MTRENMNTIIWEYVSLYITAVILLYNISYNFIVYTYKMLLN